MAQYTEEIFRTLKGPRAYQFAFRARAAAAKGGRPVPQWAALKCSSREPQGPVIPECAAAVVALAKGEALPPELVAWRKKTDGVVKVGASGVVLYQWRDCRRFEARFPSLNAAVAGLARGGFRWTERRVST